MRLAYLFWVYIPFTAALIALPWFVVNHGRVDGGALLCITVMAISIVVFNFLKAHERAERARRLARSRLRSQLKSTRVRLGPISSRSLDSLERARSDYKNYPR